MMYLPSVFLMPEGQYQVWRPLGLSSMNTEVLPFEGEQSGHRVFANNHLMLAYDHFKGGNYEAALSHIDQSEAYPENLGSGMPYSPDYRNQNTLRKMIYNRTGETLKSREASDAIEAYDQKFGKRKGTSIFN